MSESPQEERDNKRDAIEKRDVVVVGAGFAGMYMLHRLRELNLSTQVFETGDDVGGTWYWNRYPGARCDAESLAYSFSFSPELEQEWNWSERYSAQPEILNYARHVSERFDLRKDIRFNTRVTKAAYNDSTQTWQVETDQGDHVECRFCIMALGCLSVPQKPAIEGIDDFEGPTYWTGHWPHEPVSFKDQRVGIVGTGSSAVQAIPIIAEEADHLTVFQRTPNFSVPAHNGPLDLQFAEAFKEHYRGHRENHKQGNGQGFGDLTIEPRTEVPEPTTLAEYTEAEALEILEAAWQQGGARFMSAIGDMMFNQTANDFAVKFVHNKIKATVKDPETAALLCPDNHPIGTKRICVDTDYYDTYNRANVTLKSIRQHPIERITPTGIQLDNEHVEFDTLIMATGFDAMTGPLLSIELTGKDGISLRERWRDGPSAYLGLAISGFPNMFVVTGPGSPSVLSNMIVSIEQHVDWMIDCISQMEEKGLTTFEPEPEAESGWMQHVGETAAMTLFPKAGSWYMGANIEGKPRVFMPYCGGVGVYREICDGVTQNDYQGFKFA